MSQQKTSQTTEEHDAASRRAFLQKFGKLAVVTPVAMTTLMSPSTSAAPKSCRGNGAKRCT